MYPCFFKKVTYGLALKGLAMFKREARLRVHLEVDRRDEPPIRDGEPRAAMNGTLTVKYLKPGTDYVVYRFNGTEALPDGIVIDLLDMTYERRYPFTAHTDTWVFKDPLPILSDSATYYVAVEEGPNRMRVADSLKQRVPKFFLSHEPAWNPTSPSIDVRPTGDPELADSPEFISLLERPIASGGW